jgi:aldose 1-epimerase
MAASTSKGSLMADLVPLESGAYRADIARTGAGLVRLQSDAQDLVVPATSGTGPPLFRGAVLVPWPNRVADGSYETGGRRLQLEVNEPERNTALHGLVHSADFEVRSSTAATAVLGHRLAPSDGYPFELDVEVTYRLDDEGLTCTVLTTNLGDEPAPYGTGPHPYLRPGGVRGRVDEWTLEVPAAQVLDVTPDRLLPVGLVDVAGGPFDLRSPRRLGDLELDSAFTGLLAGEGGLTRVRLSDDDGNAVEVRWDAHVLPWVQVHTADRPPEDAAAHRVGLAVEPMTCPPDAFNSGTDLVMIEPTRQHSASWTIGRG